MDVRQIRCTSSITTVIQIAALGALLAVQPVESLRSPGVALLLLCAPIILTSIITARRSTQGTGDRTDTADQRSQCG